MSNFHPLEVWVAQARHNFKWVKKINKKTSGGSSIRFSGIDPVGPTAN